MSKADDLRVMLTVADDMARLAADPTLRFAERDFDVVAWRAAHPCECEAMCTCED